MTTRSYYMTGMTNTTDILKIWLLFKKISMYIGDLLTSNLVGSYISCEYANNVDIANNVSITVIICSSVHLLLHFAFKSLITML